MNKTVKVEMELPAIEGYEYTGEYREFKVGEYFLTDTTKKIVEKAKYNSGAEYPIMRPVTKWRDARASDLENGPVECRVRDHEDDDWEYGLFAGYSVEPNCEHRYCILEDDCLGYWHIYCQVKDNA